MLTRLKVSGFKNLVDVDVRMGPFTCIAGVNGVGKSNIFDAIQLLSLLASNSILEAAAFVRDDNGRADDIRNIFHCNANGRSNEIKFEVEMIVPKSAQDDLNQHANATTTFLRYRLHLQWNENPGDNLGPISVTLENLEHILAKTAPKAIGFPHSKKDWRDEVLKLGRRTVPYISTQTNSNGDIVINRHQDGGSTGKPQPISALTLPRTVLSRANADEAPTALCARREMESWRTLQLEPTSLRQPDSFNAPSILSHSGSHLPATIYRLQQIGKTKEEQARTLQSIANRVRELVPDIRAIRVEKDDKMERFTLMATLRDGTEHAARSLSDGTLRFLALVVLEADPKFQGVVCFEEPENGIHPERISNIIRLLQDIATDPHEPADEDNPLRQVIINTHSPSVVRIVPDDSLLLAMPVAPDADNNNGSRVVFRPLSDTWRSKDQSDHVSPVTAGAVEHYLNPVLPPQSSMPEEKRVVDRDDAQLVLSLESNS
ncbi:MAG: putative ATPase [Akkermansiaceae bacterium]|jgi:predicted ATPase